MPWDIPYKLPRPIYSNLNIFSHTSGAHNNHTSQRFYEVNPVTVIKVEMFIGLNVYVFEAKACMYIFMGILSLLPNSEK